ncbi:LysM domain-containing protein [uncultured Thomasclavelia sp.]|uniref:LysM peptidoglycan-binding domain-containing protein n=1 Tax=uncultured Thomasclavelia sp. TaxID=3025759 RepID=UPI0025CF6C91|nr:LysM domain-containing protein [uncultured Thomasclavelia sp.]
MYEDYMDNLFDRRPAPIVAPKVGDIFLYTVNRGDNVYAIARRFNTRVDYIKDINNLNDKLMIYPGQQLLIPVLFEKIPPVKPPMPPQPRQSYELYF